MEYKTVLNHLHKAEFEKETPKPKGNESDPFFKRMVTGDQNWVMYDNIVWTTVCGCCVFELELDSGCFIWSNTKFRSLMSRIGSFEAIDGPETARIRQQELL